MTSKGGSVYQREYVWTDKEVQRLLDDIDEQLDTGSAREYFIGAILVALPDPRGSKIPHCRKLRLSRPVARTCRMYGPPCECKGKASNEGKSASMYPSIRAKALPRAKVFCPLLEATLGVRA